MYKRVYTNASPTGGGRVSVEGKDSGMIPDDTKFKVIQVLGDPRPPGRYFRTEATANATMEKWTEGKRVFGRWGADPQTCYNFATKPGAWTPSNSDFDLKMFPWAVVLDVEQENEFGIVTP